MKTKTRKESKVAIQEKRFTATVISKEKIKDGYYKIVMDNGIEMIWKDGDGNWVTDGRPYSFSQKFYMYHGKVIVRMMNVQREYHSFG